jgi:hypothetical protein
MRSQRILGREKVVLRIDCPLFGVEGWPVHRLLNNLYSLPPKSKVGEMGFRIPLTQEYQKPSDAQILYRKWNKVL